MDQRKAVNNAWSSDPTNAVIRRDVEDIGYG